jgi:hypothetical protein
MKRFARLKLAAVLISMCTVFFGAIPRAHAEEECAPIDLAFYGLKALHVWKVSQPVRVITWASNPTVVQKDAVTQAFTTTEEAWLQEAFDSWGAVLDTIVFLKVDASSTPNIVIGYTALTGATIPTATTGGAFGQWGYDARGNRGAIRLLDSSHRPNNFKLFLLKASFIHAVQNEIGNVLGISDYPAKERGPGKNMTIFDTSKIETYGQVALNDLDAGIIRQAYGESTCPSFFTADARAKNLMADRAYGANYLKDVAATGAPSTP